jgi:hypothetical protein
LRQIYWEWLLVCVEFFIEGRRNPWLFLQSVAVRGWRKQSFAFFSFKLQRLRWYSLPEICLPGALRWNQVHWWLVVAFPIIVILIMWRVRGRLRPRQIVKKYGLVHSSRDSADSWDSGETRNRYWVIESGETVGHYWRNR